MFVAIWLCGALSGLCLLVIAFRGVFGETVGRATDAILGFDEEDDDAQG